MPTYLCSIISILLIGMSAAAHEFWIQPDRLTGSPDELYTIRLMHGERFAGNTVNRNNAQIKRFDFVTQSNQRTQVKGRDRGQSSFLRPQSSGIIVYESDHYTNNLEWDRFHAYLIEEGLDRVIEQRSKLNESKAVGREVYSRCAKSILNLDADTLGADQIDHPVGLPLEIIIDSISPMNPQSSSAGSIVEAAVTYQNEPVTDLRVVVTRKSDPGSLLVLYTDEFGKIRFSAEASDDWMITTIHIQRADELDSADWESFWASTTFSMP